MGKSKSNVVVQESSALAELREKLESEKAHHSHMIAVNKYFRQFGTVEGCEGVGECERSMIDCWLRMGNRAPFLPWQFSSSKDRIRRLEVRIRDAEAAIAANAEPTRVKGLPGVTYYENGHLMRVQLLFDWKLDPDIRAILKANAFHWSYAQCAWQRILNENGKKAAQKAIEEIKTYLGK